MDERPCHVPLCMINGSKFVKVLKMFLTDTADSCHKCEHLSCRRADFEEQVNYTA
jgi:hypothetical protein